jgi:hypothetical protein
MRTLVCLWTMAALAGAILLDGSLRADEVKVPLDKLPKPVVEAVKKRFPQAELVEGSKETTKDKTEFEVSVKNKGQKIDITLTAEGAILGLEKEIAAKNLPKAVATALKEKHPKAVYKIIEEVFKVKDGKETFAYYEVLLQTADNQTLEVLLGADGKIITQEAAKKD